MQSIFILYLLVVQTTLEIHLIFLRYKLITVRLNLLKQLKKVFITVFTMKQP